MDEEQLHATSTTAAKPPGDLLTPTDSAAPLPLPPPQTEPSLEDPSPHALDPSTQARPNPIPTPGSESQAGVPDLSEVAATELAKLPDRVVRALERNGVLYAPTFRQLQIRPEKHAEFYDGVVRFVRNKHHIEIRRASTASLKHLTDLTLRAFGYIIWISGSTWLLDDGDLTGGEVRLLHIRGLGHDHPENSRFYPIFESLWRQMRNVLFARKPPNGRVGKHSRARHAPEEPDSDTESEADEPGILDSGRRVVLKKLERLVAEVDERDGCHPSNMTADETDAAIVDLIVRLADIRARSEAGVFMRLWDQHILRVDEWEADETPRADPGIAPERRPSGSSEGFSASNEPFMTRGLPARSALIPPTRPATMSVYITIAAVPITGNSATTPSFASDHAYVAHPDIAHHWAGAPVEDDSMERFFVGANLRRHVSPAKILGWVFSYGWNDGCRFVPSGFLGCNSTQLSPNQMTDGTGASSEVWLDAVLENGDEGTTMDVGPSPDTPDPDLMDMDMDVAPSRVDQSVNFSAAQLKAMRVGWAAFQQDLRRAAVQGVMVWRMKVCVLELRR